MAGDKDRDHLKDLRVFGLSVGAAFIVVAGIFFWREIQGAALVLLIIGSVLALAGLVRPALLTLPHRGWMRFAHALGWFNTRLLLTLFFYLILAPTGLLLRVLGKHPLELEWDSTRASYWIRREKVPFDPRRCEKHF
ncbi:MAG TPA: SxtJ family membrane protein [archaeon]|nr:SxtJ family membrane protein [archaeon]